MWEGDSQTPGATGRPQDRQGQGRKEPEGESRAQVEREDRAPVCSPARWLPGALLQTAQGPRADLGKCLFPRCPVHRAVNVSLNLSRISWVTETGVSSSATTSDW